MSFAEDERGVGPVNRRVARGWLVRGVSTLKGVAGWPDVSVGGPGFCFPVERWNGREYKLQRWEYEGTACKPPR